MIVETMLRENKENIIIIGSINKDDERNVYSFEKRKKFIGDTFKDIWNITIYGIKDLPSDKKWIEQIVHIPEIQNAKWIKIYCGDRKNDYAIQIIESEKKLFWEKQIKIIEIQRDILPVSGTQVRKNLSEGKLSQVEKDVPKNVFQNL